MEGTQHHTARTLARLLGGILGMVVLGHGSFILWLIGSIEASGCFLECREPNPLLGIPLLAGAVASASGALTMLVWAIAGGPARRLRSVFLGGSALAAGLVVIGTVV